MDEDNNPMNEKLVPMVGNGDLRATAMAALETITAVYQNRDCDIHFDLRNEMLRTLKIFNDRCSTYLNVPTGEVIGGSDE